VERALIPRRFTRLTYRQVDSLGDTIQLVERSLEAIGVDEGEHASPARVAREPRVDPRTFVIAHLIREIPIQLCVARAEH